MNKEPKHILYPEWYKLLTKEEKDDLIEICDECDGTGYIDCFNHDNEIECTECEGAGEHDNSKILYTSLLQKDLMLWTKYHE